MDLIKSRWATNHIFFPPMLPNAEDEDPREKELSLLRLVQSIAEQFSRQATDSLAQWQPILAMLETWIDISRHGDVSEDALDAALDGLKSDGMTREKILTRLMSWHRIHSAFPPSPKLWRYHTKD
jgi:hypothetical protein